MQPRPPCRTTHTYTDDGTSLVYDRWDGPGRPVLLLHALLLDRTVWWPVAADLTDRCTVIAPDLPGHGETPMSADCSPGRVTADLGRLLHSLDLRRAPVVVGHATAAPLAATFAEHVATHAVLIIEEPAGIAFGVGPVLAAAGVDQVPERFRSFARPQRDPVLLAAYRSWLEQPANRRPVPASRGDGPREACCTPLSEPEDVTARIQSLL